ncbi:hypothetical protein evm_014343 [Chilo suppressalis]|nr:hypothetical protein evm_014343 [Chilo suppressalis]
MMLGKGPVRAITPVIELGSGDPALAHTARVHFTVRAAGIYTITVTIGGAGVLGSPFRRRFIAGAVCARLSRVRRHSALVCCANTPRAVILHPRDTHDNPAPLPRPPAGFTVSLSLLGSPPDASLSEAAVFSYDSVNERASLSLTFPAPGVYRAAVAYEGTVLLNGEFDCIVLSESDAAVVARQIGSRREHICYEARLLGARPRRVLCCLGPRQFIVKDYIFKFIPKRITTFRLCPSTKLTLLAREESDTGPAGSLVVEDGVQAALSLWAPRRDLLAAWPAHLHGQLCGINAGRTTASRWGGRGGPRCQTVGPAPGPAGRALHAAAAAPRRRRRLLQGGGAGGGRAVTVAPGAGCLPGATSRPACCGPRRAETTASRCRGPPGGGRAVTVGPAPGPAGRALHAAAAAPRRRRRLLQGGGAGGGRAVTVGPAPGPAGRALHAAAAAPRRRRRLLQGGGGGGGRAVTVGPAPGPAGRALHAAAAAPRRRRRLLQGGGAGGGRAVTVGPAPGPAGRALHAAARGHLTRSRTTASIGGRGSRSRPGPSGPFDQTGVAPAARSPPLYLLLANPLRGSRTGGPHVT